MIVLLLMAVMSTGSAEIIAVTSILVYDIYQLYLKVTSPDFHKLSSETKNSGNLIKLQGKKHYDKKIPSLSKVIARLSFVLGF